MNYIKKAKILPSVGNAANMSINGKEVKALDAHMDIDLSEDDLLGEENDLSEAAPARDFVGVKKGSLGGGSDCSGTYFVSTSTHAAAILAASQVGREARNPGHGSGKCERHLSGPHATTHNGDDNTD